MDKTVTSAAAAVADLFDGATLMAGGFGLCGIPENLIAAVRDKGTKGLTIISNNCGIDAKGLGILLANGQVKKMVSSYVGENKIFERLFLDGKLEVEMTPQGTLAKRIRAGGAGIPAFFTATGFGTVVAEGKETREFDGRRYVLETALRGDFALIRASRADRLGNLVYRRGSRNFNPAMATAARITVAEVDEVVEVGGLDPEAVVTPGVFVDRVVACEKVLDYAAIRELSRWWGRQYDLEVRERTDGPTGIPPDLMVRRVARLLRRGEYVNLGLGLPTLLSNALDPEQDITLHSENGMLGFGPLAEDSSADVHCYNASGQLVRQYPGASYFDSTSAFAMARSGRVTTVVLGGFQVSQDGDLANWNVPATGVGGIGGAMDLAAGQARIVVVMFHVTRDGTPKLVERCTYPLTAARCVRTIVTDLAVIDVDAEGFLLREVAPGIGVEDIRRMTAARLRVASDVREMEFA